MSIRIASRTSPLAIWQSHETQNLLATQNLSSLIIPIESSGDLNLTQPLYALGISGVFTKELDIALLENKADIAVHSLKDVPTILAKELVVAAVLERAASEDVLLIKDDKFLNNLAAMQNIATSSLRRRAQWLAKFPTHKILPIRGNVQTRLKKFYEDDNLDGIIFAKAGLERLNLLPSKNCVLDWMIPAPAQGFIGVVCRKGDPQHLDFCKKINHQESFILSQIERDFMNALEGGCSVPIASLAKFNDQEINFIGAIHDFDGKLFYTIQKTIKPEDVLHAGKKIAEVFLKQSGVNDLLQKIKTSKP